MDIYSLINSKAISAHCRKIAYCFTPLEMAYLIYANDSLCISQKHAAFHEIIAEQPDMEIPERNWTPHYDSLHSFLHRYMEIQNKYLAVFYREDSDCVYSYETRYLGDKEYEEDDRIFRSFDVCYRAAKKELKEMAISYKGESHVIRVRKQWLNCDEAESTRYMVICLDQDNNPIDIWDIHSVVTPEDSVVLDAFEGLWPEIPTPFQKGDILCARTRWPKVGAPFVLDWIPYWDEDGKHSDMVANLRKSGDNSDLITKIYGQDEDGTIWHDHGPSYLDLEYYEKELIGPERFLTAVSNHFKGELPLELLLRSYDIMKAEYHAVKGLRQTRNFFGELVEKAGLKEKEGEING